MPLNNPEMPLATRRTPLPASHSTIRKLSTHTSAPSNAPAALSNTIPRRVAAIPPTNSAMSNDRPLHIAAPVPNVPASVCLGSIAEMPIASPSVVRNSSVPITVSTPAHIPPHEIRNPDSGATSKCSCTTVAINYLRTAVTVEAMDYGASSSECARGEQLYCGSLHADDRPLSVQQIPVIAA